MRVSFNFLLPQDFFSMRYTIQYYFARATIMCHILNYYFTSTFKDFEIER